MKKYTAIITTTLVLAMLASCGGNTAAPAETTGGASPSPTETTETTAPTETAVTTVETEEANSTDVEELDFSEFDINSEEGLLYRLLDMTVGEIESEFGKLELFGIIAGGTPCYRIPGLGALCYFNKYSDDFDEPLPKDIYPNSVEAYEYSGEIQPGIYLGMDSKDLIDICGIDNLNYSMGEYFGGIVSYYDDFSIRWNMPSDVASDMEYVNFNCSQYEYETLISEVVEKMKTGEIKCTVMDVFIENKHK